MSLNSRTKIIPREIKKGEQSKATVHSNTHILPSLAFSYFLFYFILYLKWAKCLRKLTQIQCSDRMKEEEEKAREQRSYLRLHGSVHGRCVGRRAAVGERFRGAGRQRGLLGRRGGLRGALNVLTVALVGLRWRNCRGWGGKKG